MQIELSYATHVAYMNSNCVKFQTNSAWAVNAAIFDGLVMDYEFMFLDLQTLKRHFDLSLCSFRNRIVYSNSLLTSQSLLYRCFPSFVDRKMLCFQVPPNIAMTTFDHGIMKNKFRSHHRKFKSYAQIGFWI